MAWLALGGLGLIAILALLKLFAEAKPGDVKAALVWGAGLVGVVVMGLLILSGRASQAIWALALFGPAAWRWWRARRFTQPAPVQASDVETSHLAMVLDHDSGRMSGRVRAGRQAGRDLADLDLPALLALHAEFSRDDPDAVPLLEAWLDRAWPDWRVASPPAPNTGPMSRAEALLILGLSEGATDENIRAAHRRLMRAAHPDTGGSDWLASRLNEARDTLLP